MARDLAMIQVYRETHTDFGDLAHEARLSIRKYMENLAAEKMAELEEKKEKAKKCDSTK
jgi:hypothetical protein